MRCGAGRLTTGMRCLQVSFARLPVVSNFFRPAGASPASQAPKSTYAPPATATGAPAQALSEGSGSVPAAREAHREAGTGSTPSRPQGRGVGGGRTGASFREGKGSPRQPGQGARGRGGGLLDFFTRVPASGEREGGGDKAQKEECNGDGARANEGGGTCLTPEQVSCVCLTGEGTDLFFWRSYLFFLFFFFAVIHTGDTGGRGAN